MSLVLGPSFVSHRLFRPEYFVKDESLRALPMGVPVSVWPSLVILILITQARCWSIFPLYMNDSFLLQLKNSWRRTLWDHVHIPLFIRIPLRVAVGRFWPKQHLLSCLQKLDPPSPALVHAHQSERKLSGFQFIQITLADINLKTGGLPHIAQRLVTGFSILSFFFPLGLQVAYR